MSSKDTPDLNERERRILQALIDEHIATSEPVGSKAIAEIAELGVSPATIRNVLAALDDYGLTGQPHTSAGRVPTDRGLRYYVDSLVRLQLPTEAERGEIAQRIGEAGAVDIALREATRVLSRLSKQTTLVVAPRPESAVVKMVELVRLRDDAMLFILVTAEGKVQNRLLEWRVAPGEGALPMQAPPAAELFALGQKLTGILEGRTLEQGHALLAARIADARAELSALERKLLSLSQSGLAVEAPDVHVDGAAHLLEPQLDDAARVRTRELLEMLEEHDRLEVLLQHAAGAPGVRVFIGEENEAAPLVDQGLVTAPLGEGLGVLAVIGPRHLDYRRVVPLVDLTAQVVSKILTRG